MDMFDQARVMHRKDRNACEIQGNDLKRVVANVCIAIVARIC